MGLIRFRVWHFALILVFLVALCSFSGIIATTPWIQTVTSRLPFDIIHWRDDGYEFEHLRKWFDKSIRFHSDESVPDASSKSLGFQLKCHHLIYYYKARVTIQNFYQYRHVDKPGWKLGWTWSRNEVIWSMSGAFATQQGNCSAFMSQIPHSCKKDPVILDLTPDAAPENRSSDCCRGGVIAAWAVDPSNSFSSFNIIVGNLESNSHGFAPLNLTLEAPGPGYTCGQLVDTDPTISSVIGGQREEQVLSKYFTINCDARVAEIHITTNRTISQGHGNRHAHILVTWLTNYQFAVFRSQHFTILPSPRVLTAAAAAELPTRLQNSCIQFSIPVLASLQQLIASTVHCFPRLGITNEVALFWGLDFYNSELLNADEKQLGSVTSDILLEKDSKTFTLSNGWAFPRRIYFNGENCEMPPPDIFPMLPNGSSCRKPSHRHFVLSFLIYLFFKTLVVLF
ncbi:COBRA-like extracellular glycosyl-phosphatidyl inositol-anchored protein family [Actinidia rufa]|uniref:COBRA-like extracellular glycosyl-phosphatidyl inositol-anchored protein family n=1 Tax=Actinidia rufa TaxID=165716 RepID=A0A7J0FPI0_9ERIC|nr:COBRA-like extracellular glycosyl-phosphatidyl inositol-anchored protein family [Actinidia rufa]